MDRKDIPDIIFESISDGVFTVDHSCRITAFNRAAEKLSGYSRKEAIGQYCFDIFHTDLCQSQCALRHTLANGKPIYNTRVTIITKDGRKVPISVSTTLLKDKAGVFIGAVEFFQDLSKIENLENELNRFRQFGKMVSCNESMQKIFQLLPQIAESECSVLIQGPSGSGKELIAEAVHNLSPRKNNRYIRINCAALPETLLESELFGYVKGAFTDARKDKPGQFLLAQGGTLLLDEIGEMPVALQAKLLRVLNNGEFQPLGSTRTLHTDARILSSTNCDLEQRIREGAFREDLYYRINVIAVSIPPLRDRIEDLPMLVEHFIERFGRKRGKPIRGISEEALQCLRMYKYPGNVRELENAIEHAFVMCNRDIIELKHLPQKILDATAQNRQRIPRGSEESVIRETLMRRGWNRSRAARDLGMHRTTLWRKMQSYGIAFPADATLPE